LLEASALRVFASGPSSAAEKRGIIRRLSSGLRRGDVVLCSDWTLLRLFPPLRSVWAQRGTQAKVPITGANAKRVLFGAINVRTGQRVVLVRKQAGGADARAFLLELRRHYRNAGTIWLLADRASAHTDHRTPALALALALEIHLVWLPTQAPELNALDQLWRELKRLVAANRQAESVDALAEQAANWVLSLPARVACRKAGLYSSRFWLRKLSQQFLQPT
jgi:transposase